MSLSKDLVESFRAVHTPEGKAYATSFKPRPSDVFITTFPKCGTNWVCQICHMLRSDGNMDFEDANLNYPLDLFAQPIGLDLDSDQDYFPRLFKSHFNLSEIAQGGKYIYVIRDPKDATISMYKAQRNVYQLSEEQYPVDDFIEYFVTPEGAAKSFGNIVEHFKVSIEAYKRNPDNILWVYYEDLKHSPKAQIRRIAEFIGVPIEAERLEKAYVKSTFEYMNTNKAKFAAKSLMIHALATMTPKLKAHLTSAQQQDVTSMNKGVVGLGNTLPQPALDILANQWKVHINEVFGYSSYEEMREVLN